MEYIFEVMEKGPKSKLLILNQDQIGPFVNYGEHTQMIAVVDGERKWFVIKAPYEKVKREVEIENFKLSKGVKAISN